MSQAVLVRRPSSTHLAEGIVTHTERRPLDVELALKQWDQYVQEFRWAGWEIVEVPALDEAPDGVFIEDTMVVYRDLAVIARPGAPARRSETAEAENVVRDLGFSVNHIREPATLDGGDVLKVGDTIYVGQGGRTNPAGVAQMRAILGPLGAQVVGVPVRAVLHLKSAVTALPDGTVVGYPPLVDHPMLFPRFLPVHEESGSHVVDLGNNSVLMAADCPLSVGLVEELGYGVRTVDISEFQKLEGCVTCLSVRLRTWPGSPVRL